MRQYNSILISVQAGKPLYAILLKMITREKWRQLTQRMTLIGLFEEDLEERFIIGSGKGGQNLHKTSSCIFLKHRPTGLTVKCQQERSRESNRFYARRRLCEKIEAQTQQEQSEKQQAIDKVRRQKKRRTRRAKQKILDDKRHQSQTKKNRKKPDGE